MYHVVMAASKDDENLAAKVDTIAGLPSATEAVQVTLVHVRLEDEVNDGSVTDQPPVAEALDRCSEAGLRTETYGLVAETVPEGLVDAIEKLDPDLVCLGGRRRSPAGKRQLKPGAQEVILQSGAPVVVAGELDHQVPRT
jgi:nucleotide-binding universal stress UspA family protein